MPPISELSPPKKSARTEGDGMDIEVSDGAEESDSSIPRMPPTAKGSDQAAGATGTPCTMEGMAKLIQPLTQAVGQLGSDFTTFKKQVGEDIGSLKQRSGVLVQEVKQRVSGVESRVISMKQVLRTGRWEWIW